MRACAGAAVVLAGLLPVGSADSSRLVIPAGNDWVKYLGDNSGSGFTSETLITPDNASSLRLARGWPLKHDGMSTQPVVANDLVYWGSNDGYEYAVPMVGASTTGWATYLGHTDGECGSGGVAGTGAAASVTLPGQSSASALFFVGGGGNDPVGGGQAQFYALDALTGAIIWRTALGRAPETFIWSSPAVYSYQESGVTKTSVYVGVSSFSDCPLVQGKVVQLDVATGAVQYTFDVVPDGCLGGSVWGSPTIGINDRALYVATGNGGSCSADEPYTVALLKLRATDLSLLDKWQIPSEEQDYEDSDFGSAPTLFDGTIGSGRPMRPLVGIANKNGLYYVFDRGNIGAGPVARLEIAEGGSDPEDGDGSIAPSAFDGTRLYVAGGTTTIGGVSYRGSVRAWNPNDLRAPLWERGIDDGPVLGAVTAAPGLVAVGAGRYITVLRADNGGVLLHVGDSSVGPASPAAATFWGAPSIAHGTLYEGDAAGFVYAYTSLLEITVGALPRARLGKPYRKLLTAVGGSPPYTWKVSSGPLPPGLKVSPNGAIVGKPTRRGRYAFTVVAGDTGSTQQSATRAFTLTVSNSRPLMR